MTGRKGIRKGAEKKPMTGSLSHKLIYLIFLTQAYSNTCRREVWVIYLGTNMPNKSATEHR